MSTSYENVLNMAVDEAVRPPPMPEGTYRLLVAKTEFAEARNDKKTPLLTVTCRYLAALQDVDASALPPDFQTTAEGRIDFFLTDKAAFRLREAQEHMGVQTAGRTFRQTIPDMLGKTFTCKVVKKANQRKQGEFYHILDADTVAPDRT